MPQSISQQIAALEGLRGWAALLVVIYHLPKWHPFLNVSLIKNGHLMVPLFFVLSGFVIYRAYGKTIDSRNALKRFLLLRFWRLYPIHLLFLATYFFLECIRWYASTQAHLEGMRVEVFSQNNWIALVQQLLLLQAIGPTGNAQSFNGPAWSISVEFYTYVIFGVLGLAANRFLPFAMTALFLLSSGLLIINTGFEAFLTCLVGFSLGCITEELSRLCRRTFPGWLASLSLVTFFGYTTITTAPLIEIVFVLAALVVFLHSRTDASWSMKLLEHPVSLALGKVSYSLYMCHALVLWFVASILKRVVGLTETLQPDGKWVINLALPQSIVVCIVAIVVALAVAYFVMRIVEIPIREWSRSIVGVSRIETVNHARSGGTSND